MTSFLSCGILGSHFSLEQQWERVIMVLQMKNIGYTIKIGTVVFVVFVKKVERCFEVSKDVMKAVAANLCQCFSGPINFPNDLHRSVICCSFRRLLLYFVI
jgi:hypothetical protein